MEGVRASSCVDVSGGGLVRSHLPQASCAAGRRVARGPIMSVCLRFQQPPLPDGVNTIRCCCLYGCRRRCPVGRRMPCLVCSVWVGPCCGLLAGEPSYPRGNGLPDLVVCHGCVARTPGLACQWNPPVSDFRPMDASQARWWQGRREELIFEAVCRDVADGN